MDFPASLKKSFSKKHIRKISAGTANDDAEHEQLPILADHDGKTSSSVGASGEVVVKIDGDDKNEEEKVGNRIGRGRSPEYWRASPRDGGDAGTNTEDPPLKLISQFLNKQKDAGGEMTLDMDMEMEELRQDSNSSFSMKINPESPVAGMVTAEGIDTNPRASNSRDLKVSFQQSKVIDIQPDTEPKQYNGSSDEEVFNEIRLQERRKSNNLSRAIDDKGAGEVLKCTSFQRRANIMRTKTQQSRLIDPPEVQISGTNCKSGQFKSGLLARPSGKLARAENDDEDDSLFDEDNPDDFRKAKLDALTIIQWIILILILTSLICTLVIHKWKRKSLRGLYVWEWEFLVLVLICGRLVSGWAIRFVVFFIERNFLLRKRVLYFVYGIRRPVQNCLWLGLVLIAWHYMFDERVEGHNDFLRVVNKLMVCMFVATSLWLIKTLMVKVLASSFHVKKFFDRIQEALFNQYVIETLSGPPLIEIHNNQIEEEKTMAEVWKLQDAGANVPPELGANAFPSKSVRVHGSGRAQRPPPAIGVSIKSSEPLNKTDEKKEQGIRIDHLHRLNPKNVSAWNMKRLMRIVRHGALATLDEQLHNTQEDESGTQIRSEIEAKRAARKIFLNVAKTRSKFIYLDDLRRFLREEEAVKTMSLMVGTSEEDKVSKASLKTWVVTAFRERKALALTLNDTKTAVNKLHQMVKWLVGVIILIFCLLILNIATSKFLLFLSSQIVVVAFIFGNTCKTVFESIIFLFVMHPFDVGDRCEIDGVQMIVEEMNILNTVFLKWDNQKIYFPNSTLSTRAISNYYRSPDMYDTIDFLIHILTPDEKIAIMKQRIITYCEGKKDHWYMGDVTVVVLNVEEFNRLRMSVWVRHTINHQDMTERWLRRGLVVEEMVRIFKEHDIDYRMFPLDINIRNMPPPITTSRLPPAWGVTS